MTQRTKSLFYKKIECFCGQFYKSAREKGRVKYICSGYANYRACERFIIEESLLLEMMQKRNKTISEVIKVLVDKNGNIEIFYDEKNSQIISDKLIRF